MRIAIAGASGLLGSALARALAAGDGGNHTVLRLVRRPARTSGERRWDPAAGRIDGPGAGLDDVDAVVVLSGAGIGDRLWTRRYRREILVSRVEPVRTIAAAMAQGEAAGRDRVLLVPSAVGVYGADPGDAILTEASALGDDFLARVCRLTERAADAAREAGVRVVAMRTGIVLSGQGGYLGRQRLLYRAGLGGPVSGGAQWLAWITRADHVRAMRHLLAHSELSGPVNLAAPGAVRQRDFARALAASMRRPGVVPLPAGLLAPVLGPDMVAEVLRSGQRAVPERLLGDGFRFDHPSLPEALRWLPTEAAGGVGG